MTYLTGMHSFKKFMSRCGYLSLKLFSNSSKDSTKIVLEWTLTVDFGKMTLLFFFKAIEDYIKASS